MSLDSNSNPKLQRFGITRDRCVHPYRCHLLVDENLLWLTRRWDETRVEAEYGTGYLHLHRGLCFPLRGTRERDVYLDAPQLRVDMYPRNVLDY